VAISEWSVASRGTRPIGRGKLLEPALAPVEGRDHAEAPAAEDRRAKRELVQDRLRGVTEGDERLRPVTRPVGVADHAVDLEDALEALRRARGEDVDDARGRADAQERPPPGAPELRAEAELAARRGEEPAEVEVVDAGVERAAHRLDVEAIGEGGDRDRRAAESAREVSPLTLRISDVGPSDHDPQQ
jgi:hypothetical protein